MGPCTSDLLARLLPENCLVVMSGPPKAGKTDLAAALALCVAIGRPFAPNAHVPGQGRRRPKPVLWLSWEERRFPGTYLPARNLTFYHAPHSCLHEPYGREALDQLVQAVRPQLLVIDSLQAAVGSRLSDRDHALRALLDLKARAGCTLLVIGHTGKSKHGGRAVPAHVRQIELAADLCLEVQAVQDSRAAPQFLRPHELEASPTQRPAPARTMRIIASGHAKQAPAVIDLRTVAPGCYGATKPARRPPEETRLLLIRHLTSPLKACTVQELAATLQLAPKTVQNHLYALKQKGIVTRNRQGKWQSTPKIRTESCPQTSYTRPT